LPELFQRTLLLQLELRIYAFPEFLRRLKIRWIIEYDVPLAKCIRAAWQSIDEDNLPIYFLSGGTFVENMSRSSFHLPPSFRQTTMYFPRSRTLPALSRSSY
jgi:hypothetical protein